MTEWNEDWKYDEGEKKNNPNGSSLSKREDIWWNILI